MLPAPMAQSGLQCDFSSAGIFEAGGSPGLGFT